MDKYGPILLPHITCIAQASSQPAYVKQIGGDKQWNEVGKYPHKRINSPTNL